MGSATRPSVRFRRIGSALRTAREEAGLTMATAGRRFGRSPGWLSIVENGLHPIRMDDLTDLLDFYGVTDETLRASLLYLARQARRKNWTRTYEGRLSPAALDLASLESDSAGIRSFQPSLIPGLMQTVDYTRALIEAGLPDSNPDVSELIEFRRKRQTVFSKPEPPMYEAIIGEAALHHVIGGSQTMRTQLEHLANTASLDRVSIRVLPYVASACLWLAGPFHLLTLRPPGQLTVSVVENFDQSTFVEDEDEVVAHCKIFDHLLRASLDEHSSLMVIERILSDT